MKFDRGSFPNLHAGNHRGDGPAEGDGYYNCIAWAVGDNNRIWDPRGKLEDGIYWPKGVPQDYEVTSLVLAFETEGFAAFTEVGAPVDGTLEPGIEKIAIYADGREYMHAARQLENGTWTSKIGKEGERIEHDTPEDLVGPAYGQVAKFMQRKRPEKT